LVQEPIAETFYAKLKVRMDKLRIGSPLDKSIDVGAIVDQSQLDTIIRMVAENTAGTMHRSSAALPEHGLFYPPTLITGLHPADTLMQEEIFGPVLL
jgi:aldehyde dehydrogenase (NAD+)